MTEQLGIHSTKAMCISFILMPLIFVASFAPTLATAQTESFANSSVSKSKKTKTKSSCIIEIVNSNFEQGEYIEIFDSSQRRMGTAKAGRKNSKTNQTRALVIDGNTNCNLYKGKQVRRLSTGTSATFGASLSASEKMFFILPQYIVTQYTIPGLALNKFISPSYNQKGFGLRVSGLLPKKPVQLSLFSFKTHFSAGYEASQTSPAIDLLRDQLVAGNQIIATTKIDARGGVRAVFTRASSWAEIGAVLYESTTAKSSLNKSSQDETALFQAVRDISGKTFGIYLALGATVAQSSEFSVHSGIGLGGSYSTPIVEDGSFTNTSTAIATNGLPIFAGVAVKIPVMNLLFVEVNLDYKNLPLLIPLINDEVSKAQSESLAIRVGAGMQF